MSDEQATNAPADDLTLALAAMQRATEVARQRARLRDGELVVWQEGRIIEFPAEQNSCDTPAA